MANTPNYNLYKPSRTDSTVQVDTSLSDNFTIIDTEIKNRADELQAHKDDTAAHDSTKITHEEGTVSDAITNANNRITEVDTRVTDTANQAVKTANVTANQLDLITAADSIDPQVSQALVGADGKTYVNIGNRFDNVDASLADIVIDVKSFGAKGDGVTDDTTAIQNAINSLLDGQTLLIPKGSYLISNLTIKTDRIYIDCKGILLQKTSALGVALTVGELTVSHFGLQGNIRLQKQTRDWTQDNTGLKIINHYEGILTVDVSDFTNNLVLLGDASGCVYNTITVKRLKNGKKNLSFAINNSGWANENKFIGGRFQWASGIADQDRYHIYIPDISMNNNVFFSPSLESVDGGTLIYCNGQYNHFYSPRLESDATTTRVKFDTQSIYNQVVYPYAHTDVSINTTFVDLGSRNHIYSRDEMLLNNSRVRATSFQGVGNPKQNAAWGNEAVFEAQSTSSNVDKLWKGKDSSGNETSYIDGNGVAKVKNITIGDGTRTIAENGILNGAFGTSDSYIDKSFKVSAIKSTAGAPTSSAPQTGTQVLNTNENRLYIHMGAGVWKYIQLT